MWAVPTPNPCRSAAEIATPLGALGIVTAQASALYRGSAHARSVPKCGRNRHTQSVLKCGQLLQRFCGGSAWQVRKFLHPMG